VHFRVIWRLWFLLALATSAGSQASPRIQMAGAGSTSTIPIYSSWFQSFEKIHPDNHFSYLPISSEVGAKMAGDGAADFGGSDIALTGRELMQARVLQFPTVLIAIVPIYNLKGITEPIRFSTRALAGIYLGTITKWNDPILCAANPGIHLPATAIVLIHSGNGRGSTYIWSDYLSKVSAEWRSKVGRGMSIHWPVGTAAQGNGNLARMVAETPNSAGNVELAFALQNHLTVGEVQNSAGHFVTADSVSMAAAATSAPSASYSSITNPANERAYPIASFSWILIGESLNPAKRQVMKDFLRWMFTDGQSATDTAGFAPLPQVVVETELKAVAEIQ